MANDVRFQVRREGALYPRAECVDPDDALAVAGLLANRDHTPYLVERLERSETTIRFAACAPEGGA